MAEMSIDLPALLVLLGAATLLLLVWELRSS